MTDIIISQENKLPDAASVNLIRANCEKRNKKLLASKVKHIEDTSTPEINRAIDQVSEKGASSWLNVIPLEENGFNLTKGEFRDQYQLGIINDCEIFRLNVPVVVTLILHML